MREVRSVREERRRGGERGGLLYAGGWMNVVRSFWWDFSIVVSRSERSRTGKFLRLCECIITHPSYDTLMRVSITTSILPSYCDYAHTMDTTTYYLIALYVVDMWLEIEFRS